MYMAPELYRGEPYNLSADMWALGCVLFELMALKPPFSGTNILAVTNNVVNSTPEALPCDYSEDIRGLASVLLSKKPESRPTANQILRTPLLIVIRNEQDRLWHQKRGIEPATSVGVVADNGGLYTVASSAASRDEGVCKACALM